MTELLTGEEKAISSGPSWRLERKPTTDGSGKRNRPEEDPSVPESHQGENRIAIKVEVKDEVKDEEEETDIRAHQYGSSVKNSPDRCSPSPSFQDCPEEDPNISESHQSRSQESTSRSKRGKAKRRCPGRPVDEAVQQLMETFCFKLDNEILIESVHGRAPLWDNRNKDKMNRMLVSKLWREVSREVLGDNFICLSDIETEIMVDEVKTRWRSLRDRFVKDYNDDLEAASKSGSSPKKTKRHHCYERVRFLIPTLALRKTHSNIPAFGRRSATQTSGEQSGSPRPAEEEVETASTSGRASATPPVGSHPAGHPQITISRTRTNRVDMADFVSITNTCLRTLNNSVNRVADLHAEGLRRMAEVHSGEMRRLSAQIESFLPADEEETHFLLAMMHSLRMVHPAYKHELRVRIHNLIDSFLSRPPPPTPNVPQPSPASSSSSCRQ